ncbi:IS1 family transposase [Phormidium sp. FACHB-592]|nr:IS1 family transposase [Phormidium sp. FACHB-592]
MWTVVNHFQPDMLGWVTSDHHAETFAPLWTLVVLWNCYFYVTDGNRVYPLFIPDADHIVSKTDRTRVEGENPRFRHYLA